MKISIATSVLVAFVAVAATTSSVVASSISSSSSSSESKSSKKLPLKGRMLAGPDTTLVPTFSPSPSTTFSPGPSTNESKSSSSSGSKSSKTLPPPKGRMLDGSSSSYSKSSKTLPEKGRMLDSSSSSRFSKSAKSEGSGRALKSKHCHKESVMSSKSAKSLLHFDDVIKGTGWGYMPNQYEGLNWSRMGVIYHKYYNYLSGYETGNVSPDYTVWTYGGGVSTISSATSFSVYSLFATPAWSTGMFT